MTERVADAYKGIVLLKRKKGTRKEDLLDWLIDRHAHYGRAVDSIYRYTGSLIVAPGPRYEFEGGEPPFDLINEIWCKDRETLERAYAELDRNGGPKHTIASVSRRVSLIAAEYDLKKQ